MIEFGNVEFDRIRIPISTQRALVAIDLHLSSDPNKPHPFSGFAISGFPRILGDDDVLRRASESWYKTRSLCAHSNSSPRSALTIITVNNHVALFGRTAEADPAALVGAAGKYP